MRYKNWKTQHRIFIALIISLFILINIMAIQYNHSIDTTEQKINSLSDQSLSILEKINAPLQITAFVRGDPQTQNLISRIISRYQNKNKNIQLQFKNPDTAIELVKRYQIKRSGELAFSYLGKTVVAADLSEQTIAKALQSVQNIKKPTVSFLTGHQERGFSNNPSHYRRLIDQLQSIGLEINQQNLQQQQKISDNTNLLVIAEPKTALSTHDIDVINQYISSGKNTLILTDTNATDLTPILAPLNLANPTDKITNDSGKKYQVNQRDYLVIAPHSTYPPLKGIDSTLLFPQTLVTKKINPKSTDKWQQYNVLATKQKSFSMGQKQINSSENGYSFGIESTRVINHKKQRVLLIGDADFISNQFIGNGQNLLFAKQLFSYLSADDYQFIIENKVIDKSVNITNHTLYYLTLIFMVIIPLSILFFGIYIKRRKL